MPSAALGALRAPHHRLVPHKDTWAGLHSLRGLGLPAGLLPPGPRQRARLGLVTGPPASTRPLRPILAMARGEQSLGGQPRLPGRHHRPVLVGC